MLQMESEFDLKFQEKLQAEINNFNSISAEQCEKEKEKAANLAAAVATEAIEEGVKWTYIDKCSKEKHVLENKLLMESEDGC